MMTRNGKFKFLITGAIVAAGLALSTSTASAAALTGQINIANDADGGVRVYADRIDWFLPLGGGTGAIVVGGSNTGSFSGMAGATGDAKDLLFSAQPVDAAFPNIAPNTVLAGEGVVLADFLTFDAPFGYVHFDLNYINDGAFSSAQCFLAPAVGQVCSPDGSAFSLVNLPGGGSTASFSVSGFVRNSLDGSLSTFTGVYTTQFNVPYQVVLAAFATVGYIDNTYSGTFTAQIIPVVPEPATMLTFGAGAALLAARRRRKLNKVQ